MRSDTSSPGRRRPSADGTQAGAGRLDIRDRRSAARSGATALVLAATLSALAACGSSDGDDPAPDQRGGADNGTRVTLTLRPAAAATPQDLAAAREVLAARLDFADVEDASVKVAGDAITIEAPDEDRELLDGIDRIGRLDFRPVLAARPVGDAAPQPGPPTAVSGGASGAAATTGTVTGAPPETTAAYTALDCAQPDQATGAATAAAARPDAPAPACLQADGSSPTAEALLLGPSELTGQDLKSATSAFSQQGTGTWEVNLEFTSAGADRFGDITGRLAAGESPANRFAILLDGRVVTAPTVMQQLLGGKAVITGTFTKAEATRLAALLSSGTLPIPLTVASTTTS